MMGTKLIVRTDDVIKRKHRTITVMKPTIKISNNPKSKTPDTFIFFTYNHDDRVLLGINEYGEIVTILSTIDPKTNRTNINFKYVKSVDVLVNCIKANKPKTLYMNDGDAFTSLDYNCLEHTKIVYRPASLLNETLDALRLNSIPKDNVKLRKTPKIPSFRSVRSLMPDLTYTEYASIYL